MADMTTAYCDIVKYERNAEGDLVVTGRATDPTLDLDRQICDPVWLKEAVPEWYRTGANVREMHTSIAAGRGDELVQNGDGWDLRSIVVDPVSAKKVEKQILRGYSIGIRNPRVIKDAKAPGGRIVGGQIVEVSLVDRPANPTCTLTLAKSLKPGPTAAPVGAVDAERHLVKVEELHDQVDGVFEALKALDLVAVVKGDQARDIRDADQAIAIIAGLIQSEAACLADGMASEACDIDLLLNAVKALEWFKCREQKEEPAMAHVEMAAEATAEKSAAPASPAAAPPAPDAAEASGTETPPPAVEKTVEGESTTEQNEDLTELVKALTAKVDGLEGQLTKAMSAPAPGGPVLTRTTETTAKADVREKHLADAAHWARLADEVRDPVARAGFLQKAATARAAATS
jgi:hypothetical protein